MSFEDISYLEPWHPFCSEERNHLCNFGRGCQEEQFCEIILNLDQWFRRRCLLKTFLIWSPGSSIVQPNHLCNFGRGRGYQEDQFCEIILDLDQWFRRCCFKKFLSGALAALLFSGAEPFMQF